MVRYATIQLKELARRLVSIKRTHIIEVQIFNLPFEILSLPSSSTYQRAQTLHEPDTLVTPSGLKTGS